MRRHFDPGGPKFHCTEGERTTFEAGIKLGTIYHQYMGMPVNMATAGTLERTIEALTRIQPFVEAVKVKISRAVLRRSLSSYGYASLTPEMLTVELRVRYGSSTALCSMRYFEGIRYPLMFVKKVKSGKVQR